MDRAGQSSAAAAVAEPALGQCSRETGLEWAARAGWGQPCLPPSLAAPKPPCKVAPSGQDMSPAGLLQEQGSCHAQRAAHRAAATYHPPPAAAPCTRPARVAQPAWPHSSYAPNRSAMPSGQYTRIQELCGCSCGVTTAAAGWGGGTSGQVHGPHASIWQPKMPLFCQPPLQLLQHRHNLPPVSLVQPSTPMLLSSRLGRQTRCLWPEPGPVSQRNASAPLHIVCLAAHPPFGGPSTHPSGCTLGAGGSVGPPAERASRG